VLKHLDIIKTQIQKSCAAGCTGGAGFLVLHLMMSTDDVYLLIRKKCKLQQFSIA
jgi:hypothetical protein